ncbi:MAG: hypothetical protein U9Q89_08570 [Thermodesulfobacteriota bacterium]|nr:hypothetical protein [Thermodesulfobacteriota bacterium]
MQIKKDTKVKVQYRPELGSGAVLQVAEAPGGEYNVDVVFEKDGKRFLETFPQSSFLTAQVPWFPPFECRCRNWKFEIWKPYSPDCPLISLMSASIS